jgi:hypothetical protein
MGLFEAVMRLVRGGEVDDNRTGETGGTGEATAGAPASAEFASEEAADEFTGRAEEFAAAWPAYELDFSPGSLERLDTIAEEEYQRVTRAADVEEAAVVTESHGFASYFGEVLRRNHDAGWVADEEYTVAVTDGEQPVGVDAMEVAVACLATGATFAGTYRQLVE